jgi:Ca-activated chloride channel family protein
MLSDFHFLTPEWFLALLPLGAILWGISRRGARGDVWQRVVDPDLLPHLLVQGIGQGHRLPLVLLAGGWLAAVAALANPTFERLPVPVYRGELARVVVLDLSRSMEAADLAPSRLARARYKVADILKRSREGQVGLIVFAGDAFVVSPLTDDADTILSMLDAVVPEIMPVQGSRPDLALAKAKELLEQAGAAGGEVILVGDDAGGARALAQAKALKGAGYELSVIGVGTKAGAPVPNAVGADGRPVMSRLDPGVLRALASAGGGVYAPLSADGRDLDRVLRATPTLPEQAKEETQMQTEVWKELGPWILLAVLPLAALAFRRGWLLAIALIVGSLTWLPEPAMASTWDDLWQRRDQQAAAALEAGEHQKARDLAEQPAQRGTASYRLGDYQDAIQDFAATDGANAQYNRGNALAKSGQLEDAIAAYDQALAEQPGMEDASYNKALIEKLLKQQQEQQQQAQDQGQKDQQGEGSKDQQSKGQKGEEPSQSDQASGEKSGEEPGQGKQSAKDEQGASGAEQQAETTPPQQSDTPQSEGQSKESAAGQDQAQQQEQSQDSGQQSGSPQPSGKESSAGKGKDGQSEQDAAPGETEKPREAERAAADYRKEAAAQGQEQAQETSAEPQTASGSEDPSPEEREAREATDQWLRRIPDDPAGLLRRKFLYQYRARAARQGSVASGDPW